MSVKMKPVGKVKKPIIAKILIFVGFEDSERNILRARLIIIIICALIVLFSVSSSQQSSNPHSNFEEMAEKYPDLI